MRLSRFKRARVAAESGFALATVILGTMTATLVVLVAVTAVQGDLNVGKNDLDRKRAYAAAQAGLADYSFRLQNDTNYWARCTNVPAPNAVNLMGSTAKRRSVPGDPSAKYAIELIPATGKSQCNSADATNSMIETTGQSVGTFRIRSTGYAGNAEQRIVATYKRASFLDYVYFTQLETSDPVTYPDAATIAGAYTQCTKTIEQGRLNAPIPNSGGDYCDVISFIDGERIDGPFHTNDAFTVCGNPVFGRSAADAIEVSAPPRGWYASSGWGCFGSQPDFVGTYQTLAPVLTPPPTNSKLATLPGVRKFTGLTTIRLNANSMTVTNNGSTFTESVPASGVVYVANGSCSGAYANNNPFKQTYPAPPSGCGTAIVSGANNGTSSYTSRLTIAAENDIIIDEDIKRSGDGLLGLIANNFVRVKHPVCPSNNLGCTNGTVTSQTAKGSCNSGVNGTGSQSNLRIDAAILAIQHSFIVDHYDCGSSLGTLTVNGAISQKFRGAVGTFGGSGTGYLKDYNYDDRLRYIAPPSFLDPVEVAWGIQRQTLDPG